MPLPLYRVLVPAYTSGIAGNAPQDTVDAYLAVAAFIPVIFNVLSAADKTA